MRICKMSIPFAFVAFVCTSNLEAAATQKICSRLADPASMTAHLGCELFFSKELSADNSMSCATCHAPELGFADGRQVSTGVGGKAGTRNTPSLLSAKVPGPLFWDGRRASLEDLIFDPITNPLEMGLESE